MKQKNKKALLKSTSMTIFVVFLLIFVVSIFFIIFKTNTETKIQNEKFDNLYLTNNVFLGFLSNANCLAIGNYEKTLDELQVPVQAVLDSEKLDIYSNLTKDLDCLQNQNFLYSIEIKDYRTKEIWNFGVNDLEFDWFERKIKQTIPVVIQHSQYEKNYGLMSLTAYLGGASTLYHQIKRTCTIQEQQKLRLNLDYSIKYDNANNILSVDDFELVKPYFPCYVEDFDLSKNDELLLINYENGKVNIQK